MTEWSLRSETLAFTHRWPLILLSFLVGSLIGWGLSVALPNPYRAETALHVSYNADSIYRNPDDYKNWQMGELDVLVLSEDVLQETLNRLRPQDPSWQNVETEELKAMLQVNWRNVGRWRLLAEASSPRLARQVLDTWQAVILETVQHATTQSSQILLMDRQLRFATTTQIQGSQRAAELVQVKVSLQNWLDSVGQSGAVLSPLERWQLFNLLARAIGLDPAGMALLQQAPAADSPAQAYQDWVQQAMAMSEDQYLATQQKLVDVSLQRETLAAQMNEAFAASRGLTAFLSVTPDESEKVPVQPLRSTGLAAAIGGVLGVLAWLLFWLGRPEVRQAFRLARQSATQNSEQKAAS